MDKTERRGNKIHGKTTADSVAAKKEKSNKYWRRVY